jgi:hypothetical protein
VPRDKRTEVYAMAKVQKASRRYMGYLFGKILSWTHSQIAKSWAIEPKPQNCFRKITLNRCYFWYQFGIA